MELYLCVYLQRIVLLYKDSFVLFDYALKNNVFFSTFFRIYVYVAYVIYLILFKLYM